MSTNVGRARGTRLAVVLVAGAGALLGTACGDADGTDDTDGTDADVACDPIDPGCNPGDCTGPSSQACDVANGVGAEVRTCTDGVWSDWSACEVTACDDDYIPAGTACAPVITGATHYVAPDGSDDTGDGSLANPWQSLQRACTQVTMPGDLIHLATGLYDESATCVLALGVSIEGEGPDTIVTSTTLTAQWTVIVEGVSDTLVDGNHIIRHLTFDGSGLTAAQAMTFNGRNNVQIHDTTFRDFAYIAVALRGIGGEEEVPPTAYATGGRFYRNDVRNCAGFDDGWHRGALFMGSLEGMLIYDNVMVETGRAPGLQGWPIKMWYWGGWTRGMKIYDNYLEKTDSSVWDFAIEGLHTSGLEIYGNEIKGAIDLNNQEQADYPYSVYIHDNVLGPDAVGVDAVAGIILEFDNDAVLIERNYIRNASPPFKFTPRDGDSTDVTIRYNVCENIARAGYFQEGLRMLESQNTVMTNFRVYNNVFAGNPNDNLEWGIVIDSADGPYAADGMSIDNNIITNFAQGPIQLTSADAISNLSIEHNLFENCGNDGEAQLLGGTPTNYQHAGNLVAPADFVSATDFHLQATSAARDAGKDVGAVTDFEGAPVPVGDAPDIGAYEFH